VFEINSKYLLSVSLTIIIAIMIYFYLDWFLKKKERSSVDILKSIFNTESENKKKFIKIIKKDIRIILFIIIFSLLLNKLITFIKPLNEIFTYPIINHKLLKLNLINLINTIMVYFLFKYLLELIISFTYLTYSQEKIEELGLDDMIKYIGNIILIIIILGVLGVNMALLIPLAGALGIGAGFALQDLLKNVIAGLIILFGKIIKKGDYIKFNDFEGYVKEVNLRTTVIKTPNNEEVIVPNSMITENALINYSLSDPIVRIDISFGVSYSSDINKVFEIAKKIGEKYSLGEVQVIFKEFGDSSLNFILRIMINIRRNLPLKIKSEIYRELFEEFKKNNIEIPFNQLDIWFRNELKIKK
jgi:small-conductance mechanosensitive channel